MLGRYLDVFRSLNDHEVKYVLLGGVAAAIHGVPRATFDLDLFIEATPENAGRLLTALRAIGFETADMTSVEDLLKYDITILRDRVRVDILTKATGLVFEEVWPNRESMRYEGVSFHLISRDDLIQSKRAAGRQNDLQDVRALETGTDVHE